MECKDDRIDGVPNTTNGLTPEYDLSKCFGSGIRKQMEQSNGIYYREISIKEMTEILKQIYEKENKDYHERV